MASYLSRYYSVGALGGSSFGVGYGDVKCGVGPSAIHITYQNVYCWIYGVSFVSSQGRNYSSVSHSNKDIPVLHYL